MARPTEFKFKEREKERTKMRVKKRERNYLKEGREKKEKVRKIR